MGIKLERKFYVGSGAILEDRRLSPYTHNSLEEAIEEAKAKVLEDGKPRPVVEIVRVVRKEPPLLVVEEVE